MQTSRLTAPKRKPACLSSPGRCARRPRFRTDLSLPSPRVLQDDTGGILDPDESLADDPPAAATAAGNTPPIPTVVPSLGLFFLYHLYRNLLEQEGCSGAHPVPHALADGLSVPAIGDPSCDFGQEDRWCSTRSGQAYSLTALHA